VLISFSYGNTRCVHVLTLTAPLPQPAPTIYFRLRLLEYMVQRTTCSQRWTTQPQPALYSPQNYSTAAPKTRSTRSPHHYPLQDNMIFFVILYFLFQRKKYRMLHRHNMCLTATLHPNPTQGPHPTTPTQGPHPTTPKSYTAT
jgi:hypothetical protein